MRRSTIIFLLLFLVMAGAYFFLNNRNKAEPADIALTLEPGSEVTYLFNASEGVPTSIRIESKAGEVVEAARGADNAWALILPVEASADQGMSEAAASQVTTMRILDHVSNVDLEILGLKVPEYTLTVKFTSGVERKADIGVITPTETGYYVRTADGEIVIVSRDSLDALLGMLTNPPYLETPTPSPIPSTATQSPVPSTTPGPVTPANGTTTPPP